MTDLLIKLSDNVSDFIGDNPEYDLTNLLNTDDNIQSTIDCSYFEISDLAGLLNNTTNLNSFSIYSHNVRSIVPKFNSISTLINSCSNKLSILCFQEIWSIPHTLTLEVYSKFEYSSRDKHFSKPDPNCGGGIGMFIKSGLEYEILEFPNQFVTGTYESQWIKVNLGGAGMAIIGNIYCPNSAPLADLSNAIHFHSNILNFIKNNKSLKKCKLYINGDMNVDLLKVDYHQQSNEYSLDLFQL